MLPEANRYNGVFEGNGHVIRNMRIDGGNTRWDFVGLFRGLGAAGVVRNVGLVDVDVTVHDTSIQTGALAGVAYGRIASSYVAGGSVAGGQGTGGLVGELAAGTVVASYTDVSVDSPNSPLGGLAGRGLRHGHSERQLHAGDAAKERFPGRRSGRGSWNFRRDSVELL